MVAIMKSFTINAYDFHVSHKVTGSALPVKFYGDSLVKLRNSNEGSSSDSESKRRKQNTMN